MAGYDHIIVGSGINSLVAAAMLGKKGRKVLVLERNAAIGGCLLTQEVTAPGFLHDVMATTMVLFVTSPAYAALAGDLAARGLVLAHCPTPTGVLRPDGGHAILSMDRKRNIAHFDSLAPGEGGRFDEEMGKFGGDAEFVFGLLGGPLWSKATLKLVAKQVWRRGFAGLAAFFGESLAPARGYLETVYQSELMRALWAPWALHCGLGPESAYSAAMTKVIGFAIEAAGCPIVQGGARNLLNAFSRLIGDQSGEILMGADVDEIISDSVGRAGGVRLADGRTFACSRGVIVSATPQQLYGRLLAKWPTPPQVKAAAQDWRYGKGNMQIHYALSAPPKWRAGAALGDVALLHLTPGLDGVSRSANEAERGLLPAVPTICVGQPTSFDPTRAPPGAGLLWLQIPDTPRCLKGDAAETLAVPADGRWTPELSEAFADRIEAILASQIQGFRNTILARRVYSPADLESLNVNLVGGDPYGGYCGLDQFFLWRPLKRPANHRTSVAGVYHIGASTHPGPGLAGGSGFLLAASL